MKYYQKLTAPLLDVGIPWNSKNHHLRYHADDSGGFKALPTLR